MSIKLANAPVSWGVDYADEKNNPEWQKVFTEISDTCFKYAELGPYGYVPPDSNIILDFINQINIKIIGGFIFDNLHISSQHEGIRKKIISYCSLLKTLDSDLFVIIDHISSDRMATSGNKDVSKKLDIDEYKKMINFINEISKICHEDFGLNPVLHPHAGTFIEYEFEIDNVLNDVKSNYLGLCLDTAHLYYSKIDPYKSIEKYSNKIKHMHLKDIDNKILNEIHKNNIDFDTAVGMEVFCPLGTGCINFEKIFKELNKVSYNYFATIEQDIDPKEKLDPAVYAKKSLNFLKNFII